MYSPLSLLSLSAITLLLSRASADGINCEGSGLCPRATWNDKSSETIVQVLRDAIWTSTDDNSTTYNSGDHVICVSQNQAVSIGATAGAGVGTSGEGTTGSGTASATFTLSGSIGEGGICVFPQGASMDLATIRPLTDALLEHGCSTCGSVPLHYVDEKSNDPKDGILTFNYVKNPDCIGTCMSASGSSTNNTKLRREYTRHSGTAKLPVPFTG